MGPPKIYVRNFWGAEKSAERKSPLRKQRQKRSTIAEPSRVRISSSAPKETSKRLVFFIEKGLRDIRVNGAPKNIRKEFLGSGEICGAKKSFAKAKAEAEHDCGAVASSNLVFRSKNKTPFAGVFYMSFFALTIF